MALTALGLATLQQGDSIAAENPMQDQQVRAKWTLTLDEGPKALGEYSSFILLAPEDKSKIARLRFNVCPSKPSMANLFSTEQFKNNSPIALMQPSSLVLGLVAANDSELKKAKEIIDSINNVRQAEHDAYVAHEKAKELESGKVRSFSFCDYAQPNLPFTLLKHDQPNCLIAAVDFDKYKDIGTFIAQFQSAYPELKSDVLDQGYSELAKRIELANSPSNS